MLSAQEIIERLCTLQAEVWHQIGSGSDSADCFCGKGGFWQSEGYGGTFEQGYRNTGESLEFIEKAVREKLAAMRGQSKLPSVRETYMKPKSIYISLTPEQHRLLQPHFDYVHEQYVLGRPGILIAQVWQSVTEGGEPMMRVGFAEHEKALKIERSMQDDYAEDVP